MMTIEDLELAGLIGMRPDHQERVTSGATDVRPQFLLQIHGHDVRVQRMREKVVERNHARADPSACERVIVYKLSSFPRDAAAPWTSRAGASCLISWPTLSPCSSGAFSSTPMTMNSLLVAFFSSVATAGRCW